MEDPVGAGVGEGDLLQAAEVVVVELAGAAHVAARGRAGAREGEGTGPVAKNIGAERTRALSDDLRLVDGDAAFFVCGVPKVFNPFAAAARMKIGDELKLNAEGEFRFCWIVCCLCCFSQS